MSAARIAAVRRELLVRHLDAWVPAALHRSRRVTVAQAYASADDGVAEATLRVFGEFADLVAGRRVTVVVVAPDAGLAGRLDTAQREIGTPADLAVYVVPGDIRRLPVILAAAGAGGAPLLTVLDASAGPAPDPAALAAAATGRPAELLLVLGDQARAGFDHRAALEGQGFPLVTDVEMVGDDGTVALVVFATSSGNSLTAFKEAMWSVDEYAGVRYRDPGDPAGHLLDISLTPHPGPLRRELLARLAATGPARVTELRQFTLVETVFRAADANRVLTALLTAGLVSREPAHGRLAGDVLITGGLAAEDE